MLSKRIALRGVWLFAPGRRLRDATPMAESDAGSRQGSQDQKPYQVIARRFRPKAFDEVVGQEGIQATLRAALHQKRIPHAFLFVGSRGVGKTTTARILARCLNCEQGPTDQPCGTCRTCVAGLDGSNPDVVEMDAASNRSVEDVRRIIELVGTVAMMSRHKVYILDEVHMLSGPAFNALLKTLEEPPKNVVFVLATTELHKVPETIRSRCQVLHFRRIGDEDIVRRLAMIAAAEAVELEEGILEDIAAGSRGGMRDAETALERLLQVARDHEGTFALADYRAQVQRVGVDSAIAGAAALAQGEAATGLRFARELQQLGVDEREALGDLVEVVRMALLLQIDGPESGLVPHTGSVRQQMQKLAAESDRARLSAMVQAGVLGRQRLRHVDDRGVVLELTMIRMAEAGALPDLGALVAAAREGRLVSGRPPDDHGGGSTAGSSEGADGPARTASPRQAGPVTGDKLRAGVLARVSEQPLLLGTLELCKFVGPDDQGGYVVALQTERKMHRDRMSSPGLQQQIQALCADVCGRPVGLSFEIKDPEDQRAAIASNPPGQVATKVMGRFGGRVVAVDPDDVRPAASDAVGNDDGESEAEHLDEPADD